MNSIHFILSPEDNKVAAKTITKGRSIELNSSHLLIELTPIVAMNEQTSCWPPFICRQLAAGGWRTNIFLKKIPESGSGGVCHRGANLINKRKTSGRIIDPFAHISFIVGCSRVMTTTTLGSPKRRDGIAASGGGSLAAVPLSLSLSPSSRSTHRRSLNLLSPSRGVSFCCCKQRHRAFDSIRFQSNFFLHSLAICINGDTLSRSQSSQSYGS